MEIKFKKLHENAVMPSKAHPTDAGFDLVATSKSVDGYGNIVYGTGLAVEIPEGYVGLLFPRSSICKISLALTNSVGVIDSCFRGEITFKFKPTLSSFTKANTSYEVGDRLGQMIILPYPTVTFIESDTLSETDRGEGGYGSTGK